MQELGDKKASPRKARAVVRIAAVLLGAAVLCQPNLAHARGGGGHGGGFHGGGFHAGGFHGGGFHDARVAGRRGAFHGRVAAVHHGFGGAQRGQWYASNG